MSRYRAAYEDIICEDGHRHRALVETEDDATTWPPCPTCQGPTHLLALDEVVDDTRHVQVFKPFDHDGVHYGTQEQWDRYKKDLAENLKVPVESVVDVAVDRKDMLRRAEESRHRAWVARQRAGGEQAYQEHVREQRRKTGKDTTIVVGWRGTR